MGLLPNLCEFSNFGVSHSPESVITLPAYHLGQVTSSTSSSNATAPQCLYTVISDSEGKTVDLDQWSPKCGTIIFEKSLPTEGKNLLFCATALSLVSQSSGKVAR